MNTASRLRFAPLAIFLALAAIPGCRVDTRKEGDHKDVKIDTPFGGMQVKTDEAAITEGVDLPVYPGATIVKKENGKDNNAADVNMSFGAFKMRIKAVTYHSTDSSEKIVAFYRTALAKYGDVIQCDHNKTVGSPAKTSQGLTCDNKNNNHITVIDASSGDIELKTGSQQHQHIVAIDKQDNGTKIGLVALDLPGKLDFTKDNKDDGQ